MNVAELGWTGSLFRLLARDLTAFPVTYYASLRGIPGIRRVRFTVQTNGSMTFAVLSGASLSWAAYVALGIIEPD